MKIITFSQNIERDSNSLKLLLLSAIKNNFDKSNFYIILDPKNLLTFKKSNENQSILKLLNNFNLILDFPFIYPENTLYSKRIERLNIAFINKLKIMYYYSNSLFLDSDCVINTSIHNLENDFNQIKQNYYMPLALPNKYSKMLDKQVFYIKNSKIIKYFPSLNKSNNLLNYNSGIFFCKKNDNGLLNIFFDLFEELVYLNSIYFKKIIKFKNNNLCLDLSSKLAEQTFNNLIFNNENLKVKNNHIDNSKYLLDYKGKDESYYINHLFSLKYLDYSSVNKNDSHYNEFYEKFL